MSKITDYIKSHLVGLGLSLAIVLIITFGFIIFRQHNTITLTKTQLQSLTDTVKITRNKLGQEVATRQSMSGDLKTTQALLKAAKADSNLQAIAKVKSNVTGITSSSVTKEDTSVLITNSTTDTAAEGVPTKQDYVQAKKIYEDFVKQIHDPWYDETITKKADSLSTSLIVRNKYAYSIGKVGDTYTVKVTNLNPHTETQDIQSYYVTPPPANRGKYFLIGGGVGAGVLLVLLTLLKK